MKEENKILNEFEHKGAKAILAEQPQTISILLTEKRKLVFNYIFNKGLKQQAFKMYDQLIEEIKKR